MCMSLVHMFYKWVCVYERWASTHSQNASSALLSDIKSMSQILWSNDIARIFIPGCSNLLSDQWNTGNQQELNKNHISTTNISLITCSTNFHFAEVRRNICDLFHKHKSCEICIYFPTTYGPTPQRIRKGIQRTILCLSQALDLISPCLLKKKFVLLDGTIMHLTGFFQLKANAKCNKKIRFSPSAVHKK